MVPALAVMHATRPGSPALSAVGASPVPAGVVAGARNESRMLLQAGLLIGIGFQRANGGISPGLMSGPLSWMWAIRQS